MSDESDRLFERVYYRMTGKRLTWREIEEAADRYEREVVAPQLREQAIRDAELLVKYWFQRAKTRFPPKRRES